METPIARFGTERAKDIPGRKGGTIVVVEDPFIQKYVRSLLSRHGCQVAASDVAGALEMLRSKTEPVSLVITNTPRDFLAVADSVPVLYIAAAPDYELATFFLACRVLRKPFHPNQLVELVKELTAPV
ncbi:MAG TPA: hypothetical protein VMH81_18150 [Bryobacteraceae bacterium]|nr:hypothetical protein [Bryobacteraceae bacterium]